MLLIILHCIVIHSTPQGAVKVMAKDLVRTRNYITRFIEMKTHLNAVGLKMQVRFCAFLHMAVVAHLQKTNLVKN